MDDFLTRLSDSEFQVEVLANTGAIAVDPQSGKIVWATSEAHRIFKCQVKNGLSGRDFEDFIPAEFRGNHKAYVERYREDPHPRSMGVSGVVLRAQDLQGNEFPVAIALHPLQKNEKLYVILIILPLPTKS